MSNKALAKPHDTVSVAGLLAVIQVHCSDISML